MSPMVHPEPRYEHALAAVRAAQQSLRTSSAKGVREHRDTLGALRWLDEAEQDLVPPELAAPEYWRQSYISRFDACPLSLRFELETGLRQLPHGMGEMGALGTLFHRLAAKVISILKEQREPQMSVEQIMDHAVDVIGQRDIPAAEVVHVTMRELQWLRVLATKFSYHSFDPRRIMRVEKPLLATLQVRGADGEIYDRLIKGTPDVLMAGPGQHEATLIDWKSGWAPPSKEREPTPDDPEPGAKLSEMGYVQQVVYGWLVLKNFPSIQRVTESEWYMRHDQVREDSIERWEIERVEDILAGTISQMDAALEEGAASQRWFPIPGSHCGTCPAKRHCPIKREVGIPADLPEAQRLGREWLVSAEIRKDRTPYLKGWVAAHGPIPIAHAKGRREIGYKPGSRTLSMYEPEDIPASPFDEQLAAAATDAGVLSDG